MRDQLAKLVEEPLWGSTARERSYETADAIIAALPDMVQPLVWIRGAGCWRVKDEDGATLYEAYGGNGTTLCAHWRRADVGRNIPAENLGDAKAAAQADYTRRILSAFGITGET
jgi:hypothetical protein